MKVLSEKGKETLPGVIKHAMDLFQASDVLVGRGEADMPADIVRVNNPTESMKTYLDHVSARLEGTPERGELRALLEGLRHAGSKGQELRDNIAKRLR